MISCVFCSIRDGRATASMVHEDDQVLAFMDIRPIRRGQVLVIPKQHVDHFADLRDDLATSVFLIAQRLARVLRGLLKPKRVGMVVHGFGVAHAHIVVVPLEHPWDITAKQYSSIENGQVMFRWETVPVAPREDLDAIAEELRQGFSAATYIAR
ncbi:MAG: HIT family protein [Longimicrobiales bacterium]